MSLGLWEFFWYAPWPSAGSADATGGECRVVVYDVPVPSLQASALYYYSPYSEQPPAAETQPHFLAAFRPAKLFVWPFFRQNPDVQPPVIETNVHTIGFFKNPPQWSFKFNSWDQSQPPVTETNVHFLATFKPIKLTVLPLLSQQQHWDAQPPVQETNVNTIGKFTPVKYTTLSLLSQQQHWDAQPAVAETNVHTIGRFTPTRLYIWSSYYLWNSATDFANPLTPQEGFVANPHFVAAFRQAQRLNQGFLYNTRAGEDPPVVETNTHFLAKFAPARLTVWPPLRQHADFQPPVVETNINFLAGFKPTKILVSSIYSQNPATDIFVAPATGAEPHFIGRFAPVKYQAFGYNTRASDPAVVETNVHTIGFFRQPIYWRFNYNSWDQSQPPVIETNVHYIARFTPAILRGFALNSIDTTWDVEPPVVETNPHFVAKYSPARLTWFAYNSTDTGVRQAETNRHFVGSFQSAKITKLASLWNNQATDFIVTLLPNETGANSHFVGKFTPTHYNRFIFNGTDTQPTLTPEFWATAAARNLTATDAGRSLIATPPTPSRIAIDAARNLSVTATTRTRTSTWSRWN